MRKVLLVKMRFDGVPEHIIESCKGADLGYVRHMYEMYRVRL